MKTRAFFTASMALVFLLHAFLLWAGPRFEDITVNGKPLPDPVAKVNGTPIAAEVLKREIMAFKMMASQSGQSAKDFSDEKIAHNILEQEINFELLYQECRRMNISVEPKVVLAEVDKIKSQFPSAAMFESAMMFQGLTEETLKTKINRHLMVEEYMRREIVPKATVGEKEARSYYEQNRERFVRPQMYQVSHIFVATIDSSKEGNPEDAKEREKAQRMIQTINSDAREKIGKAAQALETGMDFSQAVKEFSEDEQTKKQAGELGILLPNTTIPEIASAMVKLKPGQNSEIVKSSFGYHIVHLTDIVPSKRMPFEEVQPDILNLLLKVETETLKNEAVKKLKKTAKIETFI